MSIPHYLFPNKIEQVVLTTGFLSTGATPTSTTASPSSTSAAPTSDPTQTDPSPSYPTETTNDLSLNPNAFHYYFLIIAVVALACLLGVLYLSRRKKRKAELMRSNSQRALARDVEGFRRYGRTRGRTGLGWPTSTAQRDRRDVEEGFDERGEAPPPYVPGTKPPSLRSVEREIRSSGSEHAAGEAVELRPLSGEVEHPPGYDEQHPAPKNDVGITRPDAAVTTSERFSSTRRYTGHTGGSEDSTVVR
jgi:hypothetical protein